MIRVTGGWSYACPASIGEIRIRFEEKVWSHALLKVAAFQAVGVILAV
jgi:hypothetical protein